MRYSNATLALFLLVGGCKSCGKTPPPPVIEEPPPPPPPEPEPPPPPPPPAVVESFQRVFFNYDATSFAGASRAALEANAAILQRYPELRVEVQGHADDRGTTDYNLALGERRANAIRDALATMGASSGQISVISYGEERPLAAGAGESSWSQNRRAEFRVKTGASAENVTVNGTL